MEDETAKWVYIEDIDTEIMEIRRFDTNEIIGCVLKSVHTDKKIVGKTPVASNPIYEEHSSIALVFVPNATLDCFYNPIRKRK